ncbi:MAG: hypothetical protein WCA39_07880 [Nitrososphaeraceae archaeon]
MTLESVDEDDIGETIDIIWELEPNAQIYESISIPKPSKWDSLDRFQAFIYAITSSSAIDGHEFSSPFHARVYFFIPYLA